MITIQIQLSNIVKRALTHLSPTQVEEVVIHLMSDDVGVTSLTDLKDLTLELMPKIPPLKQRQLLAALTASQASTSNAGERESAGGSSSQQRPTPPPRISTNPSESQRNDYKFKVVWNDLPQATLHKLDEAETRKQAAANKDFGALKLAISKKVVSSYIAFRAANPGCKLSPGREVYGDITDQVFEKYEFCLKVAVNGKEIGDGKHTFKHLLGICIENLLRKYNKKLQNRQKVSARKGKGTVGVKPNEYEPRAANKEEQENIKDHLQTYFLVDESELDLPGVTRDIVSTFELQRADIIEAKAEVLEENDDDDIGDDEDDHLRVPAMKRLLAEWPFLLRPEMMRKHHDRLTGRDIFLEINKFIIDQLDMLLMYMTTCSNSNIANLALRLQAEKCNWPKQNKLIMALMMVANHFKEDYKILILNAERTIPVEELDLQQKEPCIVAFGQDPIGAEKFVVCADKTALIKCNNEIDAVTSLFEACFVFDLQYPKLPLTVEFFERMVFGMGFSDTRVENKKGKLVLTLTDGVKRLINGLQTFEEEYNKQIQPNTDN